MSKLIIGWREWAALPKLGIKKIKVKVDTGAKTSALDAREIEHYRKNNIDYVRFLVYPAQRSKKIAVKCKAKVVDVRTITDSGGHKEKRYVIATPFRLNQEEWIIELSLTCRATMGFRMLLGRSALKEHAIIEPAHSFLAAPLPIVKT